MKIAFLISKIGKGGAEQVVIQLSEQLIKYGHDNICICLEEFGTIGEKLKDKNKNIFCISSNKKYDIAALFRLYKLLKSYRPDVLSLHSMHALPYVAIISILLNKKIIFTAHGLLYKGFERKKRIYRFFSRFIDVYTSVSSRASEVHRDFMCWGKKIFVIENGSKKINKTEDGRRSIRYKYNIMPDTFLYLVVGNIKREKGFEVLFDSLNELKENRELPNHKILIVGNVQDEVYKKELDSQISFLGLADKVLFAGYHSDCSSFFSGADAFVLSSHSEGLPMGILEAMSCALPVIATSVGGIPKVLSDGAGILVEPNSPLSLASAMADLMLLSDEKRNVFGLKAYQRMVSYYSLDRMTKEYLEAFKEAANV